jgi:hypothetical protein
MSMQKIGIEPQPSDVKFPPGRTTLVFKAQATPAADVMVTYQILSSGVTFENGTSDELLARFPVGIDPTPVEKPVRFTFEGDTPPLEIHIAGTATPLDGSPTFSLNWFAHVDADAIPVGDANLVAAGMNDPSGNFVAETAPTASPARELAMLMRRACGLLEAIHARSQPATEPTSAKRKSIKPKKSSRRPAGKRKGSR